MTSRHGGFFLMMMMMMMMFIIEDVLHGPFGSGLGTTRALPLRSASLWHLSCLAVCTAVTTASRPRSSSWQCHTLCQRPQRPWFSTERPLAGEKKEIGPY